MDNFLRRDLAPRGTRRCGTQEHAPSGRTAARVCVNMRMCARRVASRRVASRRVAVETHRDARPNRERETSRREHGESDGKGAWMSVGRWMPRRAFRSTRARAYENEAFQPDEGCIFGIIASSSSVAAAREDARMRMNPALASSRPRDFCGGDDRDDDREGFVVIFAVVGCGKTRRACDATRRGHNSSKSLHMGDAASSEECCDVCASARRG